MADLLLDSDVVIWHLRGKPGVVELVVDLAQKRRLGISAITRTEVLVGMRRAERDGTFGFLDACETLPVDAPTADSAADLVRRHRERGLTLAVPDALIAATALGAGIPLYTCNPRHYGVRGLEVRAVRV